MHFRRLLRGFLTTIFCRALREEAAHACETLTDAKIVNAGRKHQEGEFRAVPASIKKPMKRAVLSRTPRGCQRSQRCLPNSSCAGGTAPPVPGGLRAAGLPGEDGKATPCFPSPGDRPLQHRVPPSGQISAIEAALRRCGDCWQMDTTPKSRSQEKSCHLLLIMKTSRCPEVVRAPGQAQPLARLRKPYASKMLFAKQHENRVQERDKCLVTWLPLPPTLRPVPGRQQAPTSF